MEIITFKQKQLDQLSLYPVPKSVSNTESTIYSLDNISWKYDREKYLLKKFYIVDDSIMANRLFNISLLNSMLSKVDMPELVAPHHIVSIKTKCKKWGNQIIGFTIPTVEYSTNLGIVLRDFKVDNLNKVELLYLVGRLLKKTQQFKRQGIDFSFSDFHEDNILVVDNQIRVIDLDSSYFGAGYPMPSRYLATNKNLNMISKYKESKNGLIIPNRNTDLLCYNMMILNTIGRSKISFLDMNSYFQYLQYLKKLGYGKDIIKSFERLYSSGVNINPCDYLDQIPTDKIGESQYKIYELKKKKGMI